ncbi:MAG: hypothetical protein QM733_22560 [Ilumatobacteraceae bacterium]
MHRHRLLTLLLTIVGALAVANPAAASGNRGNDPLPEVPAGRSITLTNASVAPGGQVSFTGTGFVNDCATGQTVTVKLNDIDILGTATARDDGTVTGSVTIPSAAASLGYSKYWLRFLVGSGATTCNGGDAPPASLFRTFELTTASSATATTVPATTTTTATAGGGLPSNGFDVGGAVTPVIVLGAIGVVLLLVQRRMARA